MTLSWIRDGWGEIRTYPTRARACTDWESLNPPISNGYKLDRTILKLLWDKPVIVFYKERLNQPERSAFLVVKAMKLVVSSTGESTSLKGRIKDFFPLMGDIDYVSSERGKSDRYVLCWFDDKEDDFRKSWRRLTGVTFPDGISYSVDNTKKRIYNADFEATEGKLK